MGCAYKRFSHTVSNKLHVPWRLACRTHAPAIYILPTPSSQERVLYGFTRLYHVGDVMRPRPLSCTLHDDTLGKRGTRRFGALRHSIWRAYATSRRRCTSARPFSAPHIYFKGCTPENSPAIAVIPHFLTVSKGCSHACHVCSLAGLLSLSVQHAHRPARAPHEAAAAAEWRDSCPGPRL